MKIEKLTAIQEKQLIDHREKYLSYGLSCEPANKQLAVESIAKMYSLINRETPYFWLCSSPLMIHLVIQVIKNSKLEKGANLRANLRANLWANLGANLRANLRANLGANLWDNLGANLGANLWDNLGANLWDNLGANLGANLRDNLGANLRDNLGANLRANLWANLGANLRANLRDNLGANLWANLGDNLGDSDFWGQLEMYWICYYQYPKLYLNIEYNNKHNELLTLWDNIGQSIGWWYPYEKICFISDRPKFIHKKGIQLHNDNGPALEFRDGYSLWFLNGVNVGKKIVETPAELLDPARALTETNADVQREIIRKIGAERMLKATNAKTLDTWDDPKTGFNYKLMDMSVGNNIRRRYLYFEHASMKGVYFAKPVPPETAKAMHGYAWQRKLLTRKELTNVSLTTEAELIANLPAIVC